VKRGYGIDTAASGRGSKVCLQAVPSFPQSVPVVALSKRTLFLVRSGGEAALWTIPAAAATPCACQTRAVGSHFRRWAAARLGVGDRKIHLWEHHTGKHLSQAGDAWRLDSLALARGRANGWPLPLTKALPPGLVGAGRPMVGDLSATSRGWSPVAASPTANLLASSGRNPKISSLGHGPAQGDRHAKRTRQRGGGAGFFARWRMAGQCQQG